jgi:hypothetical protein
MLKFFFHKLKFSRTENIEKLWYDLNTEAQKSTSTYKQLRLQKYYLQIFNQIREVLSIMNWH